MIVNYAKPGATAPGDQPEKESHDAALRRQAGRDAAAGNPPSPAGVKNHSASERAGMSARELVANGPGNLTDAEARDYCEREALQAEIDAKSATKPPAPSTFTAEQRAAASPLDLLKNGAAVDAAAADARRTELDDLRRRAAS